MKASATPNYKASFEAKLVDSLLTKSDAKKLGFVYCTAAECAKLGLSGEARAGFKIPYFDLEGRPTKFFRYRYLQPETRRGFAALIKVKEQRYAQPKGSINELYLAPSVAWKKVAQDVQVSLIITEGELKAACACKAGLATIGLGGVWCWRSAKNDVHLLPAFEQFDWTARNVVICFDSDAATNHLVASAENALCKELLRLGAKPSIARLPAAEDGSKVGLDDYLLKHSLSQLQEVLSEAVLWDEARELFLLNEEVVYIEDPGIILRLDTLQTMAPRAFVEHAYAPWIYHRKLETSKGVKISEESAARAWLSWPMRSAVRRLTYKPGEPRLVNGELNSWPGWGCEPVKGDVGPWRKLLDYVFQRDAGARHWFEQWLAYPLQHPGAKLYTAAVIWGIQQGTGKTLIGYTMFEIYGRNAAEIGDANLTRTFNDWAANKQFILGDEIVGGDKRGVADKLKSMITQKTLRVERKYVPSYTTPDCINYFFTSNHPDAFFIDDTDRRFFVHEIKDAPLSPDFYQKEYMSWLRTGGAEALFDYLLKLDLSDFNPEGRAPMTLGKREMIVDGRSDVGSWVATLREAPLQLLYKAGKACPFKLWSTQELLDLYDPDGRTKITSNGLGRALRTAGFDRVNNSVGLHTDWGQQRLWAILDIEGLKNLPAKQLAEVYNNERKKAGWKPVQGRKF